MVDHFLELGCGFDALVKLQIGLPTHIRGIEKATRTELRRREAIFVTRSSFKGPKSLGRVALLDFDIGPRAWQPIALDWRIEWELLCELVDEFLCLREVTGARQRQGGHGFGVSSCGQRKTFSNFFAGPSEV